MAFARLSHPEGRSLECESGMFRPPNGSVEVHLASKSKMSDRTVVLRSKGNSASHSYLTS